MDAGAEQNAEQIPLACNDLGQKTPHWWNEKKS